MFIRQELELEEPLCNIEVRVGYMRILGWHTNCICVRKNAKIHLRRRYRLHRPSRMLMRSTGMNVQYHESSRGVSTPWMTNVAAQRRSLAEVDQV